jgi:hypothetical protein
LKQVRLAARLAAAPALLFMPSRVRILLSSLLVSIASGCAGGASSEQPIRPPNADGPDAGDADAASRPPPVERAGWTVLGSGHAFVDVSTDQGGNVWGVTADKVYFFRAGAGDGITFDQADGLAQGKVTWTDTYWFGTPASPSTEQVLFTAVAGGQAGEAFVGNIGMLGDRLQIDPSSGAVESVVGLAVTSVQQSDPTELEAQREREVAVWHAVVDLNGTFGGTAYFGGWHGTSALHGMARARDSSVCGCTDFEEHVHAFSAGGDDVYGGDVHGLALTPAGDLWIGDRKALYFLPQGSRGADTDLFQTIGVPGRPDLTALDVFPGVDDWTYGLAIDASGGLYVASFGNGLAYLAAGSYSPTYWKQGDSLPTNFLTGVDIDRGGDVWIATKSSGALRYRPATGAFTAYTTKSGLPSNNVRQVSVDRYGSGARSVAFATGDGIAVYTGP